MHITWHGHACVKLQTATASLLINPFQDTEYLKMPKLKVDIVASSDMKNDFANHVDRLQGDPFLLEYPGEYEVSNIFIYGIPLPSASAEYDQNGFILNTEGITIAYPGITLGDYSEEQLEKFNGIDILFLPLSHSTLKQQKKCINQIEPRMIIPIQYAPSTLKKAPVELVAVDEFLKEMGVPAAVPEQKIIVKSGKLPQDETTVVLLDIT